MDVNEECIDKRLEYLNKLRIYWEKQSGSKSEAFTRYFLWSMMNNSEQNNIQSKVFHKLSIFIVHRAIEGKF